ncbi:MAG: NrpR regulatory domain-containing protein [Candidatus Bathyarchaeia archaeon]
MHSVKDDVYRKEMEILRILSEHREPIGSMIIRNELSKRGFLLSDRAIRYHLKILEERGLVRGVGVEGRVITDKGLDELKRSLVYERIGSILTRYLSLAYRVTYDLDDEKGDVVANVTVVDKDYKKHLMEVLVLLKDRNLLPAPYYKILNGGEEYRGIYVPEDKIIVFTVCNLTLDGILIHSGIPLLLKYGGLVQFIDYRPVRFTELIAYESTTMPPLEIFVYRRMTSIMRYVNSGSGLIPANLREIPMEAYDKVREIIDTLHGRGWRGMVALGKPNEPILGIPISMDRFGLSMVGGLVPSAALVEIGVTADIFAPHLLMPIEDMEAIA